MTEAIARGDPYSHMAFIMNQMLVINYILRKNIIQGNNLHRPRNNNELWEKIRAAMVFPSDFGGLPLSTLYTHTLRGHDDKLTLWFSLFKTAQKYKQFHLISQARQNTWQTYPSVTPSTSKERERLFMDPFCLNITSLPSAEYVLRDLTTEYLQSDQVTNPMIKRLYDSNISLSSERLLDALDSFPIIHPSIGHELLSNSNYGLMIRLRAKLTSSKTIERLVKNKLEVSLVDFISRKNQELIVAINRKIFKNYMFCNLIIDKECVTRICEEIRTLNWGKTVVFITKPPPQCQLANVSPQRQIGYVDRGRCLLIETNPDCCEDPSNFGLSWGPFTPYIGSATEAKIKKPTLDFTLKTNVTKALDKLRMLRGWCIAVGWTDMTDLCTILIKEKLRALGLMSDDKTVNDLTINIVSGNLVHRFQSQLESNYAIINISPTVATHFSQSSNLLRGMTQAGEDYTIFYQELMVRNMASIVSIGSLVGATAYTYLSELRCRGCTQEIDDDLIKKVGESYNRKKVLLVTDAMPIQVKQVLQTKKLSLSMSALKTVYSLVMGWKIGYNIDENFTLYHSKKMNHKKYISSPKSAEISINDFKAVDLEIVLIGAYTMSNHCQKIISNKYYVGTQNSNDYSFTYLAELLSESGRIAELYPLTGIKFQEHTQTTQTMAMSGYLAKSVFSFLKYRLPLANRLMISVVFSDDDCLREIDRYQKLLYKVCTLNDEILHLKQRDRILLSRPLKIRDSGVIRRILRVGHYSIVVPSNPIDIQTLWRCHREDINDIQSLWGGLCDRGNKRIVYLSITSFPPLANILDYHIDRSKFGPFRLQYMSFLSRYIGSISSAATKYIECLCTMDFNFNLFKKEPSFGSTIYSIAEGSGGTLATMGTLFPGFKLAYNTLLYPNIDNRDNITFKDPPSFMNNPSLFARLIDDQYRLNLV